MNNRTAAMVYAALIVMLLICVVAVSNPEWTKALLSVVFAALLVLGPFKIGEDFFDAVDKHLDRYIEPDHNLHIFWHCMYAVVVGLILLVVWPSVALFLIESDHLMLYEWHQYFRLIDDTPSWLFGYPRYAIYFGYVAFANSVFGYVVEGIIVVVGTLAKNRMKRGV